VDKRLDADIVDRMVGKLPMSADSAKYEALDQDIKDLESQVQSLFTIPNPPPPPTIKPSAFAEGENEGLKKKLEEMEAKIKAYDTLERKMERIALSGKMSREDKEKYRREAGLEKRLRASQPKWDGMMEAAKGLMERQRVDSPNHISNFKVDRFISRMRAGERATTAESTTDADEDEDVSMAE